MYVVIAADGKEGQRERERERERTAREQRRDTGPGCQAVETHKGSWKISLIYAGACLAGASMVAQKLGDAARETREEIKCDEM